MMKSKNTAYQTVPFSVVQCLGSQTHLGHESNQWNPNISQYILGERVATKKEGSKYHVFDVSMQLTCLKRALRVITNTASKCGPNSILLIGKSPQEVSAALRFANPYEEILKSAAIASGASIFAADSQTWVSGSFTNWNESSSSRLMGQSDIKTYGSDKSNAERSEPKVSSGVAARRYPTRKRSATIAQRDECILRRNLA